MGQAKSVTGLTFKDPSMMLTSALGPSMDDFTHVTCVVLNRCWFGESESRMWARAFAAETKKTPYLGHCILSVAALQTSRTGSRTPRDSVSAYRHHVQASELFRKVTPVVTEQNWLSVLTFQGFVVVFEFTSQTYCAEAEFDIAKVLKVLHWNSKIGREAMPYFVCTKLWQVILKRTRGVDLPPDPALQASLRTLGSAIDNAAAGMSNDPTKLQRAEICQEAFAVLCDWVEHCSSWPRSIDGYYYLPARLQSEFLDLLEEEDDMAMLLILYWSVVLWRSPMPAVWKWAYRTAQFILRILQCKTKWRALLEWPRHVLCTAASPGSGQTFGGSSGSVSSGQEDHPTDPWRRTSSEIAACA